MLRKQLEIPPTAAEAFVRDMKEFFHADISIQPFRRFAVI
jgi:hypothetical protein